MLLLIPPLILLLQQPQLCSGLCHDTNTCIERIRKIAAEPRRYWFGEQWWDTCSRRNTVDRIRCYNPELLQAFHSLGSRLFRVTTYQNEYLKNLRIFPAISYRPTKGIQRYRACDHDFVVNGSETVIEANPDMEPAKPYDIRYAPDVQWTGIANRSYLIIAIDVGFGTLNYLAVRSPISDKVHKEYTGPENFRNQPNPVVFLIFETFNLPAEPDSQFDFDSENFDLPKFMIDYSLENGLIGMNILLVSTDPYAIEKQRLRDVADNCYSLVVQRIKQEKRWPFTDMLPLSEVNNWVSVSFEQPNSFVILCCRKFILNKQMLVTDPLSDEPLPSAAVRKEPRVTAMKNIQNERNGNNNNKLQRNIRNHIGNNVVIDKYNTLVLFDAKNEFLYWMIVDIPPLSLAAGDVHDGNTVVPYLAPIPRIPKACTTAVLTLLTQQPSTLPSAVSKFYKRNAIYTGCQRNCSQRSEFNIAQFKSLHQLQLSAVNWLNTCYDVYEAAATDDRQKQPQPQTRNNSGTIIQDNRHQVDLFIATDSRHGDIRQLHYHRHSSARYRSPGYYDLEDSRKISMDFCTSVGLTDEQPCYLGLASAGAVSFHSVWMLTFPTICYLSNFWNLNL